MSANNKIIQSYVFRDDKCFFVSTINRESSSMMGGTYAETMAWEVNYETKVRGTFLGQDEGPRDSTRAHFTLCQRLIDTGICKASDE